MISVSWNSSFEPNSFDGDEHIRGLMKQYKELPRHIAKKHLKAAMRRTLKPGVAILRKYTPPLNTKRGRKAKGAKRSTGALRRSVTVKAGQTGKNLAFDAFIWGVLGYRFKGQDRKAIWCNYGTSSGARAFNMIEKAMTELGPISAQRLAKEMKDALEKATAELAGGKNAGYKG